MKNLLSLIGMFLLAIATYGQQPIQTITGTYTNGGIQLLLTNAATVTGIVIYNADATNAVTATFYDNGYPTNIWTNSAYTEALTYTTNLTKYYTNAEGIITTNTITGAVWTTTSTVAASSNLTLQTIYSVANIPILTTSTSNGRWDFAKGVVANLSTNLYTNTTVTLYYRRYQ